MILRVALDTPLRQLFDYLAPERGPSSAATGLPIEPAPGMRVAVPFGRQRLVGLIVAIAAGSELPEQRLKPAWELLDAAPIVDAPLLALLRWAADYYHHPIGEVIAAALPKLAREGAKAVRELTWWSLTAAGEDALAAGEPRRAPRQRALLERLAGTGGVDADTLAEAALPGWREAAKALVARGWISSSERPGGVWDTATQSASADPAPLPQLSDAQQAAVDAVLAAGEDRFHAWLLHGITGSGKTEVYLRLVERTLARRRRALVLVPEIGLTPQLVARFTARFATVPLALLHSGLTDGQRLAAWRRVLSGEARLVLGTRSAVFAPVPELGLIVIDEEHDASFKQQEGGFRYSARDLAIVRAQALDIPVMLGSATPALESLHNVATRRFRRLSLPRRAAHALPPTLRLIDLRQESVRAGLSTTATTTIERHLGEDGQVLVYINRRGYAPTLACKACGWVAPCADCDARMTVHLGAQRLRCHHCGADRPLPRQCTVCGYELRTVGQGTERVEETLTALFPQAPIARLDRDVVRHAGELEAVVGRVARGEARILVGTQMVTKGHDFPNVTLVVVLNADQGLFNTDFRAAERLAQTIVQVAGRAGRGDRPGEVLIQTEYPEHPLLRSLLTGGYDGFAETALRERREAAWPPFMRLAALRASGTAPEAATDFLAAARRLAQPSPNLRVLGPAPAAMARRAGRHHAQLLVESTDRGALHRFLDAWLPEVGALPEARKVRWALDVDPLELF
ncbi:MAG: primosomal protein N' [Steroidobacteraceae bacterium]|nr:primosomal protein N' [Nevskiaceae bacterium]MCP5340390.1 primosomal protein N' [Nevskiaceae bacterium]MCP5360230.1 primosomal protein N' [Nevskiaceae bacterium]MCP5466633.1 primosomal protein N' [Nevskiaceae bacterium]